MLLRHNGASTPAKGLRRPLSATMNSYLGTSSFATDSMKPLGTLLAKATPRMVRASSPSRIKVWQPARGIVFGDAAPSPEPAPLRALSTTATSERDHSMGLHAKAEDIYALASLVDTPSLDSKFSPLASPSSSEYESSSWIPSSASMTAESADASNKNETFTEVEQVGKDDDDEELHVPLTFQIPKEVFQEAKDAAPGTKESFWSYKLYIGPNNREVKVHYCKAKHTTERVVQYFVGEKVIGFDIEWKPESTRNSGIKNNVSLIQIASEKRIGLFHIAAFPKDTVADLVAPTLKKVMEDPEITKVGVAIKGDCTRLRNFLKIEPRGIFELSHLYKLVRYSSSGELAQINKKLVSLATQAEEHLGLPIFKGEVRGSDWTQPLAIEQIIYAASDAYANLMLFDTLESKRKQLKPVPPRPYHAELNLPIRLTSGTIIPAIDETVEDLEPEVNFTAAPSNPASAAEAAAENVQIEEDAEPYAVLGKVKMRPKAKAREIKSPAPSLRKSEELLSAEAWVANYRALNPSALSASSNNSVSFSVLRAYALWQNNTDITITQIATMLRDPPLQTSTVANYILESVRLEKLPFEKERLKIVLKMIPESSNMWRYKGLWKMIE